MEHKPSPIFIISVLASWPHIVAFGCHLLWVLLYIIITTGKLIVVECLGHCRVPDHGHSAKMWFAECQAADTRQKSGTRHARALPNAGPQQIKTLGNVAPLPSAGRAALGKARARAQHARPPCAARQGGWRRQLFAECLQLALGKGEILPSASSWHSAKYKRCRVRWRGSSKVSFAECWCPGTRQTWLKKNLGLQIFLVST